jgi:cytochrome b561
MNARNVSYSGAFHPLARLLHWLMAILILTMLFIGAGMVSTVSEKHEWLLAIHKPLGATIFVLALIRLGVRLRYPPPPLPADMPPLMKFLAHASHWLLYTLMLALPLVGCAMLSAGGYPISLGGGLHLPPLLPFNGETFAWLRETHRYLAYLLFFTVLGHMGAALYHGLIRRDGVLASMTFPSRTRVETGVVEPVVLRPAPGEPPSSGPSPRA